MKTGLFFGTFNPIHHGHLMIANYLHSFSDLEEIWFIVTPQSPFKQNMSLLPDRDRLHLVNLAIDGDLNFKASDIEFNLPQPNYTIHTLKYLEEKYPERNFSLIMGGDNLYHLHKWYNVDQIVTDYNIYVYLRPGAEIPERWETQINDQHIKIYYAPQMEISSSFIRQSICDNKDVRYFVPQKVYNYIKEMHFYEK